jgi:hypothetical protein
MEKSGVSRCSVLHMAVQDLHPEELYDFIICGVPFNNFSIGLTREIFRHMTKLLKPGGTLTFFEYKWIRRFKGLVANRDERKRLTGVGQVLGRYLQKFEFQCNTAWVNFPPAMAHHLKLDSERPIRRRKKRSLVQGLDAVAERRKCSDRFVHSQDNACRETVTATRTEFLRSSATTFRDSAP